MKSLFTEDGERYTPDATALDREVSAALAPIFSKYVAKGYRIREVAYLMGWTINDLSLEESLSRRNLRTTPEKP